MKRNIILNNCRVSYDYVHNEGAPTVVFVHGYGVNSKMWQPQVDFLSNEYTIINIDVRGHGLSRPCDNFSIKEAVKDLRNILLVQKCEKYILIGLSMGGYIVQEYAFSYGGALGYMIVGATPIFLSCYTKFEKLMLKHSAGMMKLYPWSLLKSEMVRVCITSQQGREHVLSMFDEMTKSEFISLWFNVANCLHEELMRFDAPLLVTCGENDRTGTVKKCLKEWKLAYENCEVRLFKNAAHVANLDTPEEFNKVMKHFIENCTYRE